MCPPEAAKDRPPGLLAEGDLARARRIAALRERLGPELLERTPLLNDDFSLERWMDGWDDKLGKFGGMVLNSNSFTDFI